MLFLDDYIAICKQEVKQGYSYFLISFPESKWRK